MSISGQTQERESTSETGQQAAEPEPDTSQAAAQASEPTGSGEPGPGPGAEPEPDEQPPSPTDHDFVHVFKRGVVVGTPLSFVLMAVLLWLAAPEPGVLLAALWPAIMGGWYFGAMTMLAIYELRGQRTRLPLPGRRARSAT